MSNQSRIDLFIHLDTMSSDIGTKLNSILSLVTQTSQGVQTMSAELDALGVQVTQNTTIETSAVTLINGIASQLTAIANDPVQVKAFAASLNTSATALSAAIVANTPATPPGPVVTPPVAPPPGRRF